MRHAVCLVLLVPILALATEVARPGTVIAPGVPLQAVTVLPSDGGAGQSGPQSALARAARPGSPSAPLIRSVAPPMTTKRTARHTEC